MYRKSIRAENIDAAFAEVMHALSPSKGLVGLVKTMLQDAWGQRLAQANTIKETIKRDIAQLDKQLDGLLDRIVESDNPTVIAAFEKKITKLERDKLVLADKMDQKAEPKHTLEEIFELSMTFLATLGLSGKTATSHSKKQCLDWCLTSHWPIVRKVDFELRKPLLSLGFWMILLKNVKWCG